MPCDGIETSIEKESTPTWAPEHSPGARPDWRIVHRALRAIRHSRAGLDAEEMCLLREAEALQIWRPLGMVSALDYLERELGYAPRTAQDRLRVARALGTLPRLTAALSDDQLPFSAVRELTRVAVPATEAAWIAAATGKNLRQIEELVANHRSGDRPDDPPDPEARTHVVRFELAAETFALLRQTRTVLNDEHGTNLSDDSFVAALCNAVLDGTLQAEPTGRAKFQIAVTVCQRCRRGWQEGAGAQIAIDPEAVDRAMCDAQHIGSIDGSAPERAYQDIPPSVARFVWRRDGGRCRVDGCRSSRGLELHHLVHRANGGSHDAMNLALICSACHLAHHRGALTITGTADHLEVHRPGQAVSAMEAHDLPNSTSSIATTSAHVDAMDSTMAKVGTHVDAGNATSSIAMPDGHGTAGVTTVAADAGVKGVPIARMNADAHVDAVGKTRSIANTDNPTNAAHGASLLVGAGATVVGGTSKLDAAILRTQAKAALTGLGWKPAVAAAAVAAAAAAAAAAQGAELTLERLIFESLRRCPTPRS